MVVWGLIYIFVGFMFFFFLFQGKYLILIFLLVLYFYLFFDGRCFFFCQIVRVWCLLFDKFGIFGEVYICGVGVYIYNIYMYCLCMYIDRRGDIVVW